MTKKKVLTTEPQAEPLELLLPESAKKPAEAPRPEARDDLPYTLGTWHGMTQWKCKLCPWDTIESEAALLEHVLTAHRKSPPLVQAYSASGKPIDIN